MASVTGSIDHSVFTRGFLEMRKFFISSSWASVMFQGSSIPWKYAAGINMSKLSHQVMRPPYRSSQSKLQESSFGSTLSVRYNGAAYPQSAGMKYCLPWKRPDGMNAVLIWPKLEISDVSHGCTTGLPSDVFRSTQFCQK